MPPVDWDAASPHHHPHAVPVERFKLDKPREVWFLGDVVVRDTHWSQADGSKPCRKQAGPCSLCEDPAQKAQQNGFFACYIKSADGKQWLPAVGVLTQAAIPHFLGGPQRGRLVTITRVKNGNNSKLIWNDHKAPGKPNESAIYQPPYPAFDVAPHVIRSWYPTSAMPEVDDVPPPIEIQPAVTYKPAPIPPELQEREDRTATAWKKAREAEKNGANLKDAFEEALRNADKRDLPGDLPAERENSRPNQETASGAILGPISAPPAPEAPSTNPGSIPPTPAVVTEKIPEIFPEPRGVSAAIVELVKAMDDAELAGAVAMARSMPSLAEAAAAEQYRRRQVLAPIAKLADNALDLVISSAERNPTDPTLAARGDEASRERLRRIQAARPAASAEPAMLTSFLPVTKSPFTAKLSAERNGGAS